MKLITKLSQSILIMVLILGLSGCTSNHPTTSSESSNSKKAIKKPQSKQKKSSSTKKKTTSQPTAITDKQELLKLNAQAFGQKSVEAVKNFSVAGPYEAKYIENIGMSYQWTLKYGTLIRIDDQNKGITTIYQKDDKQTNDLGQILYQGQTIVYNTSGKDEGPF